jgi:hypothetical protein
MKTPQLICDQRGTAFAEALVALPLFVAALVGVVALNSMYSAKLEARARARRLAWLQADSGECPAQNCRSGECGTAESAIRAAGLDDAGSAGGGRFSVGSFLGDVGSYLRGRATHGIGLADAPMPSGLGGGRTQQRAVSTLLCNTRRRTSPEGNDVLEHACSTGLRSTEYASEVCR